MDDNDMEMEMGTPPLTARTLEIEVGDQEVITIDLDALDQSTDDVIAVLQDAQCKVTIWTQLASEYWRRGWLESAQKITNAAVEFFKMMRDPASLAPVYLLLANIQIDGSRAAPKMKLLKPQLDKIEAELVKDVYLAEATSLMNHAGTADQGDLFFLTRGIHQLAKQSTMNEALMTFEGILAKSPTNLVALHGKARIMYARKNYRDSLQIYQRVLRLSPNTQPDPRIGIGLCLWQLGDRVKAKAAWERSLEVHPNHWVTELLLGLESLNASKDSKKSEEQRRQAYTVGSKHIERSFSMNQKNAASANCLSEYFIRRNETRKALKLAERAIQFADTLAVVNEGHLRAGRVAHQEGRYDDAMSHYSSARGLPLASVGIAQCHIKKDETSAAIHVLDTMLNGPDSQRTPEAMIMLASLRASERPALSAAEYASDKIKAREMYERVRKDLAPNTNGAGAANGSSSKDKNSKLLNDMEMNIELARLWQSESMDKAMAYYQEARQISEGTSKGLDPRIVNNIAVLGHLEGNLLDARALYEQALGVLATSWAADENMDAMSTTVLYNLARIYEDQGELLMAKEAYDKLLSRHPEYIDAKVRLAHMLLATNRNNEAHTILKQALETQVTNLNLRAYYTHFLIQSSMHAYALSFVHSTLQINKSDLYGVCAAAWLHYHLGREIRDTSPESIRDRRHKFRDAAELYGKALNIDPGCSMAAQGLAIMVAEDALGVMSLKPAGAAVEDEETRLRNTRDALDVFAKVREVLADGSVYVNMGHCYYLRDEYERAIESYETGLRKYYDDSNAPVLMCLSRTWYAKAMRDQSFGSMKTALYYSQKAQHVFPMDKSIRYNIAVIQQKAAEMLFSVGVSKRTLEELQQALEYATHAQSLLSILSEDTASGVLPYDKEMAQQRRRYGIGLLRKGADQVSQQEKFESEHKAKIDAAREVRMAEKAAVEAKEKARLEELQRDAELLAEERRKAREEAALWAAEHKDSSSEDEKPKRRKKEKQANDDLFDDAEENDGALFSESREPREPREKKEREPKEPKVKKERKAGGIRRRKGKDGKETPALEEGLSSGEDAERNERPKKRTTKKRVVNDEDEELEQPSRKKFKSADYISDSDEELDRLDKLEEAQALRSQAATENGTGGNTSDVDMS